MVRISHSITSFFPESELRLGFGVLILTQMSTRRVYIFISMVLLSAYALWDISRGFYHSYQATQKERKEEKISESLHEKTHTLWDSIQREDAQIPIEAERKYNNGSIKSLIELIAQVPDTIEGRFTWYRDSLAAEADTAGIIYSEGTLRVLPGETIKQFTVQSSSAETRYTLTYKNRYPSSRGVEDGPSLKIIEPELGILYVYTEEGLDGLKITKKGKDESLMFFSSRNGEFHEAPANPLQYYAKIKKLTAVLEESRFSE